MKKTFTFILVLSFLATSIFAGPIDQKKAFEIASSFWRNNARLRQDVQLKLVSADKASKAQSRFEMQAKDAQYYIFNSNDNNGFVIVSGDDLLTPVIGYSDRGNSNEMPPALAEWLAEYSSYVDEVRAGTAEPILRNATAAGTRIEPMLGTSWNQSAPYNNYCPTISGSKAPTGCTATAMAQIMKFHEWPASPTKDISWTNNLTGKTETIGISKHIYAWDKMLPHYRNGYTSEQADAVAQLMVDVGKAIRSNYALAGTGSSDVFASNALVKIFNYSPEIFIAKRNEYTYDEFIKIIRDNLSARQPLLHCGHGQSYAGGHAFVCDGIDENNLLHIDWGWDGAYNGYFDIGSMSPGGTGIGGGQDRYNVGQSIIANIRPRATDESDRNGDPTIFTYEIIDDNDNYLEERSLNFTSGTASFKTVVNFLNWSHSTLQMKFGYCIKNSDGSVKKTTMFSENISLVFEKATGYYLDIPVSNNPNNDNYLKAGTYTVHICYTENGGDPIIMRGENNSLTLEVNSLGAKLSKTQPKIRVSDFVFRDAPEYQNEKMKFDVAFRNDNTNNATVVIVPIINKISNNTVVRRDTLHTNSALINVLDNTDFIATYSIDGGFPGSGDYYVSFAYDLRNSYTNHDTTVEKKKLKSISGQSQTFTISPLPDGAIPTLSSVSVTASTVGKTLRIIANVSNESATNTAYSGTLGLFTEKDGNAILLVSGTVEGLKQGGTFQIQFNSTDYVPVIGAGTYTTYVCELVNDEWTKLKQNSQYGFTLKEATNSILYADSKYVVDNDNVVVQGDSADVIARIGCENIDFDGYLRVNVLNGLTMVLRSDYIPASIKAGEVRDFNLRSMCGTSAPLAQWKLAIKYYDKNKREIGPVSGNAITYPENGYFWVADKTAIDDVHDNGIDVGTNGNSIVVSGAENAEITIYSVDGKEVYNGRGNTVAVERGMYIIAVQTPGNKPYTTKVFVK